MARTIAVLMVVLILAAGCAPTPAPEGIYLPSAQQAVDGMFGGSGQQAASIADNSAPAPAKEYRLSAITASSDRSEALRADRSEVQSQIGSVHRGDVQSPINAATPVAETPDAGAAPDDSKTPVVEDPPANGVPGDERDAPALWIDMSMGAELIDWFNRTAYPVDIARADHVSRIDMLDQIEVGRRLVIFRNVADAEELLPRLHDKMDVIGYNLEHGPANRDDRDDPVGSVRRMRELADEYGLLLALGPDHTFAVENGVEMAPYVDIFVLQVQRVQTEPETVRDFVLPLVKQFRAVNPDIQISMQVRTEGDPQEIADLILSMGDSLDAVSVLTSPESTDIAMSLVADLRQDTAHVPMPTPTPSSQGSPNPAAPNRNAQAMIVPTAAASPRKTMTSTTASAVNLASSTIATDASNAGLLLFGGLAGLGVIVSGLLATLAVFAYQKLRVR